MTDDLDTLAPNYHLAKARWPEAPTLASHYQAVADSFAGTGHSLLETVKSFVECVCLTILGEFGHAMPSSSPTTTELLVECLRLLGVSNSRGVSKLDKVLSAYNRLADALNSCRNEVGPVAHGKDGFLDALYTNQLRTYLLTGDALLALIIAALEGTEPHLLHTREPYDAFSQLHRRIDKNVFIRATVEEEDESPVLVFTAGTSALPDGVEIRVEPSRLLYCLDRAAFIELLAASTTEGLAAEEEPEARPVEETLAGATLGADEPPVVSIAETYEGRLKHLQGEFDKYLGTISLDPAKTSPGVPSSLGPSLLATAEANMGLDWRLRESLQSKQRIALRRVLARFGISPSDAKNCAEHILTWLHIQTAPENRQKASEAQT